MATTLIAGDTLAKGMVMTWADWSPLPGLPLWVFICAFLMVCLLGVNLSWLFKMKKLNSVRGYARALKESSHDWVMCWIVSSTKSLVIECLKKSDAVLSFPDKMNISRWVHESPISVIHIGGLSGVIASEAFYRTRDLVAEIALCHAIEDFNANQEKLAADLKKHGSTDKAVAPIKNFDDYVDYGRNTLEQLHPDGLEIDAYSTYQPMKMLKYFPKGLTAALNGGIFIRDARELMLLRRVQDWLEKHLALGLIAVCVMVAIAGAWFVPLGK